MVYRARVQIVCVVFRFTGECVSCKYCSESHLVVVRYSRVFSYLFENVCKRAMMHSTFL